MITKYTVAHGVYDDSLASAQYDRRLEDEVNRLIEDGWQPYGPLVSSSDGEVTIFVQPMVQTSADTSGVGQGVFKQVNSGHFG